MPIEILMPALSPTMTEGTLANWLKKEGDAIKAGQVLAEIETDKATMEVEAVDEGTLGKILVAAGTENVAVNTPIALLLEKGEDAASLANYVPKGVSAPIKTETPLNNGVSVAAPMILDPVIQRGGEGVKNTNGIIKRLFVSPLARKIAEQRGAHLGSIQGTGPNGRIIKADVERALSQPTLAQGQAAPVAAAPAGPNAKEFADALGMVYREEKVSAVRKVIAQRLTESKQTVPHFYLTVAIALDNLMAKRAELNDAAKGAYKLSVNDFIVKACAAALKKVPAANAAWNGSSILYYDMADISVAVATPNGLVTPIVKSAETKSLADISAEVKDLALRAKDGKLKPQEFQGGTFTISNLGMFGINEFSAIINPPQACILAVGAGEPTPVVVDGQVKIANVMKVTLSVDHRVVDGAVGAEYLQALKGYLEAPETML